MANLLLGKCNSNIYDRVCLLGHLVGPLVGNLKNEIIKFYDKPKYG